MISVTEIYQSFKDDVASAYENGALTYAAFNRLSKRAELRVLAWLTGTVEGSAPMPYLTQKNKDYVSDFIVSKIGIVSRGTFAKPDDYSQFENLFYIQANVEDCDSEEIKKIRKPIELLNGSQFSERCRTDIDELKPENKPIAKLTAKGFEFAPEDLGNVQLEYIRKPKFAVIAFTNNLDEFGEQQIDVNATRNYEWPEDLTEPLLFFMSQFYAEKNREQSLQQHAQLVNKQP